MLAQESNLKNVRLQKKIGTPSIKFWSTVHSFSKDDETVVVVLTINPRSESFDLKSQGEEILTYLENRYKTDTLPLSVQKIKDLTQTTVTRFEDAGAAIQMAVLKGEAIYLCTKGGGEVVLKRGGNTYKLISKSSEGKALSGPVKEGDLVTLTAGEEDHSSSVEIAPIIQKPVLETTVPVMEVPVHVVQKDVSKKRFSFKLPVIKNPRELLDLIRGRKRTVAYEEAPPKNTVISVGIILLILLGISIGFGLVQKARKERIAKYETRLVEAQKAFDDSVVQAALNPRAAKELYLKSQGLTAALKEEGVQDERLTSLDAKLKENEAKLLGVVGVMPEVFLDLSLVRSGITPVEIVLDAEKMVILDKAGNRVVTTLTDATGTTVIGGTESVGNVSSVATYAGRVFTLSEKGILELATSGNVSVAVAPDEEWGNPLIVRAFGSNLYIATQEGEIWRFPAVNKGFSTKQRWLGPGVSLSYGTRDLALDGSIWVLSENSKIQKYTRGAPNSFVVKDVSFSDATALYTDETTESLFVLDANNSRIAQLSKTGDLEKEYKSEDFKEGKDLVVSSKVGKIFLLTSTKILEIPLAK